MRPLFEFQCWMKRLYRQGPRFQKHLKLLERTRGYSEDALRFFQNEQLRKMVRHCYRNVPYYQDLFHELRLSPEDIQTYEDLKKLPVLDKKTVKLNFDKLIDKKRRNVLCKMGVTSGTTGSPARFLRDYNSINFEYAATWRLWHTAGDYGKKRASMRGGIIVPVARQEPPFWRYNPANLELQMSSFHLSPANSKAYIDEIVSFEPKVLYCLPSNGALLAKFFRQHKREYFFDAVFTSSEALETYTREYIEDVFQCRVYDWYGQAERVAAIGQCEHGSYHIEEDYSVVELLENEDDGSYELVGTHLHNYVMPLLRYRTHDHVYLSEDTCACGSAFRKVDRILGRSGNFLITPEGCRISITAHIPCGIDNLIETQFCQKQAGEVTIKILTNGLFTDKDREQLIRNTLTYTSPRMKVDVKEVTSIPRGPNGKFISVINEIGMEN